MNSLNELDARVTALSEQVADLKLRCLLFETMDEERQALRKQIADGNAEIRRLLGERRAAARGLFVGGGDL